MYRQGDILIIPTTKTMTGKPIARDNHGRLVLAEGEATGHAHCILDNHAALITSEQADEMHLMVYGKPAALVHDEHDTIMLPPDKYIVRKQREYAYGETIRVED